MGTPWSLVKCIPLLLAIFLLVLAGILPHLSTTLVPVAFFVVLLGMILCIVHERGR